MRVAVRGFAKDMLIFEEILDTAQYDLTNLARDHVQKMTAYPDHMIEVEFIDEPDNPYRFFRFGTDPSRMAIPLRLKR